VRTTDRVASIIVLLGSVALLAWIIPTYTAPPQSPLDIPPDRLPSIAIWTCLVMAAMLGLGTLRTATDADAEDEEFGATATGLGRTELGHIASLSMVAIAVIVIMPLLGFEITMGAVLLAAMLFLGQRNIALLAAAVVIVPVGLSQIAWHVFTVEFP